MAIAVPSRASRHFINRFSYGYTPALRSAVAKAGGGREWFNDQLAHTKVVDIKADAMKAWFPYLKSSSRTRQAVDRDGRRSQWELSMDLVRWTILRRMLSNRQLFETWRTSGPTCCMYPVTATAGCSGPATTPQPGGMPSARSPTCWSGQPCGVLHGPGYGR
jgi:Protein of unknown function (DUF1800)